MSRKTKLLAKKYYRRYATSFIVLILAALGYGMMVSSSLNIVVAGAFALITCIILIAGIGYKIIWKVKKPSSAFEQDASSSRDER